MQPVSFTKVLQKPIMMETIGSWEDSQRGASFVERRGKGACLWAPRAKPEALWWCNAFIVSQSIIGEICHWARKFEEKNHVGWTNLVFWISRVSIRCIIKLFKTEYLVLYTAADFNLSDTFIRLLHVYIKTKFV